MKRILITGANSFIGINYRKYSKISRITEISLLEKKPEEVDFTDVDVVLHLAAIVHQTKKTSEEEYFRVNRDLCIKVAEEAKKGGVKQFVFLSTLKVYGKSSNEIRNEDSECIPEDAYGKSKFAAEQGLRKLEDQNFTISVIRTPIVYGEGVKTNMISLIKLIDILPILPFANVQNKRNFTYTQNLAGFIDKIIEVRASGIFIAMDERSLSTTELVESISAYLRKRIYLFRLPLFVVWLCRLFFPRYLNKLYGSMEFDNSKSRLILDFKPLCSTEEGIRRTVEYYLHSKRKH